MTPFRHLAQLFPTEWFWAFGALECLKLANKSTAIIIRDCRQIKQIKLKLKQFPHPYTVAPCIFIYVGLESVYCTYNSTVMLITLHCFLQFLQIFTMLKNVKSCKFHVMYQCTMPLPRNRQSSMPVSRRNYIKYKSPATQATSIQKAK